MSFDPGTGGGWTPPPAPQVSGEPNDVAPIDLGGWQPPPPPSISDNEPTWTPPWSPPINDVEPVYGMERLSDVASADWLHGVQRVGSGGASYQPPPEGPGGGPATDVHVIQPRVSYQRFPDTIAPEDITLNERVSQQPGPQPTYSAVNPALTQEFINTFTGDPNTLTDPGIRDAVIRAQSARAAGYEPNGVLASYFGHPGTDFGGYGKGVSMPNPFSPFEAYAHDVADPLLGGIGLTAQALAQQSTRPVTTDELIASPIGAVLHAIIGAGVEKATGMQPGQTYQALAWAAQRRNELLQQAGATDPITQARIDGQVAGEVWRGVGVAGTNNSPVGVTEPFAGVKGAAEFLNPAWLALGPVSRGAGALARLAPYGEHIAPLIESYVANAGLPGMDAVIGAAFRQGFNGAKVGIGALRDFAGAEGGEGRVDLGLTGGGGESPSFKTGDQVTVRTPGGRVARDGEVIDVMAAEGNKQGRVIVRTTDGKEIVVPINDLLGNRISMRGGQPAEAAQPPLETPDTGGIYGSTDTARGITNPGTTYDLRYKLVDANDLVASHTPGGAANPAYPAEIQPRARERVASAQQVADISNNLVPAELLGGGSLDRGTPIVGPDNVVESGNGRTMALQKAITDSPGRYSAYRTELESRAAEFGLKPEQIQSMKNPVLVRERVSNVDRPTFAAEANYRPTLAMSPSENAVNDAGRLSNNITASLRIGDNQSVDQALLSSANSHVRTAVMAAIPAAERAALSDASGNLSRDGLERIKSALFAKTYPGADGQALLERFRESTDPGLKNIETALFQTLPIMARAEALTRTGARDAALALGPDLAKAITTLSRMKQAGLDDASIKAELLQMRSPSLFGGTAELTPEQVALVEKLDASMRTIKGVREFLTSYARGVEDAQPTLIGGAITKASLLEQAGVPVTAEQGTLGELGRASLGTEGGAGETLDPVAYAKRPLTEGRLNQDISPNDAYSADDAVRAREVFIEAGPGGSYDPGHPWYYKTGGKPLTPEEIIQNEVAQKPSAIWLPQGFEKLKNPAKQKEALTKALVGARESQAEAIKGYNDLLAHGADAVSDYEKSIDAPQDVVDQALALRHNHIVSSQAQISTIEAALRGERIQTLEEHNAEILSRSAADTNPEANPESRYAGEHFDDVAPTVEAEQKARHEAITALEEKLAQTPTTGKGSKAKLAALNKEIDALTTEYEGAYSEFHDAFGQHAHDELVARVEGTALPEAAARAGGEIPATPIEVGDRITYTKNGKTGEATVFGRSTTDTGTLVKIKVDGKQVILSPTDYTKIEAGAAAGGESPLAAKVGAQGPLGTRIAAAKATPRERATEAAGGTSGATARFNDKIKAATGAKTFDAAAAGFLEAWSSAKTPEEMTAAADALARHYGFEDLGDAQRGLRVGQDDPMTLKERYAFMMRDVPKEARAVWRKSAAVRPPPITGAPDAVPTPEQIAQAFGMDATAYYNAAVGQIPRSMKRQVLSFLRTEEGKSLTPEILVETPEMATVLAKALKIVKAPDSPDAQLEVARRLLEEQQYISDHYVKDAGATRATPPDAPRETWKVVDTPGGRYGLRNEATGVTDESFSMSTPEAAKAIADRRNSFTPATGEFGMREPVQLFRPMFGGGHDPRIVAEADKVLADAAAGTITEGEAQSRLGDLATEARSGGEGGGGGERPPAPPLTPPSDGEGPRGPLDRLGGFIRGDEGGVIKPRESLPEPDPATVAEEGYQAAMQRSRDFIKAGKLLEGEAAKYEGTRWYTIKRLINDGFNIDERHVDAAGRMTYEDVKKLAQDWDSISGRFAHGLGQSLDTAISVLGLRRALMAAFDLSWGFRQGVMITMNPLYAKITGPGFKAGWKALWSENAAAHVMDSIDGHLTGQPHPLYDVAVKSGLDLTEWRNPAPLTKREEDFQSVLSEWVPGLEQSNRAFVAQANKVRMDLFTSLYNGMRRGGAELSDKQLQHIAKWVNVVTGRGDLPSMFRSSAPFFNAILFAPRFFASQVEVAALPLYFAVRGDMRMAAMASRDIIVWMGASLALLKLTELAGAQVEYDPRSSNFLKITEPRTGITVDPFGGKTQLPRLIWQTIIAGQKIDAKGNVVALDGKGVHSTPWEEWGKYLLGKSSPNLTSAYHFLLARGQPDGKVATDVFKQKVTLENELNDVFPLGWQDLWAGWQADVENGGMGLAGGALGALSLLGFGVQADSSTPLGVGSALAGAADFAQHPALPAWMHDLGINGGDRRQRPQPTGGALPARTPTPASSGRPVGFH